MRDESPYFGICISLVLVLLATLVLPGWLSQRDEAALARDRNDFQHALRAELAGKQCLATHRLEDVHLVLRPVPDPQTNAVTFEVRCLYVSGIYGTRPRYRTLAPTYANKGATP